MVYKKPQGTTIKVLPGGPVRTLTTSIPARHTYPNTSTRMPWRTYPHLCTYLYACLMHMSIYISTTSMPRHACLYTCLYTCLCMCLCTRRVFPHACTHVSHVQCTNLGTMSTYMSSCMSTHTPMHKHAYTHVGIQEWAFRDLVLMGVAYRRRCTCNRADSFVWQP